MIRDAIRRNLSLAVETVCPGDRIPLDLAPPKSPEHGDLAANVALVLAAREKRPPRELAQAIVAAMPTDPLLESVGIAGPGFINFRISPAWLRDCLARILDEGSGYGRWEIGRGKRVQVEFVSANPVGPIHIGNARGGPYGDVLAGLFAATGHDVEREFYVNDGPFNTQAQTFGRSLQARYRELLGLDFSFPDDGYRGQYVREMAAEIAQRDGDAHAAVAQDDEGARVFFRLVLDGLVEEMRQDCAALGIEFDRWFRESELYEDGAVDREVARLLESGVAYEADGAIWLRTQAHGDDQDRVLVRADGRPTYIASDVAYARSKIERGFEHAVYILGPDHAGYIPRMKAAFAAIGIPLDQLEIRMYQNVRLVEGGEVLSLSKRKGSLVTMREIVDDIGRDAARFFLLMRSAESHLDLDLDLARSQSEENPVYYVQYAHTRIRGIEREAQSRGITPDGPPDLSLLTTAEELALLRKLAFYPDEVLLALEQRAPHRLPHYARELAQTFHQFYTVCRVLDESSPQLSAARLALAAGTRVVLANVLGLMGISAPERM